MKNNKMITILKTTKILSNASMLIAAVISIKVIYDKIKMPNV